MKIDSGYAPNIITQPESSTHKHSSFPYFTELGAIPRSIDTRNAAPSRLFNFNDRSFEAEKKFPGKLSIETCKYSTLNVGNESIMKEFQKFEIKGLSEEQR